MTDAPHYDLTDPATFDFWTDVTLRFCDQDSLGHVNNVAYAAFFEASRTDLLFHFMDQEAYPSLNFTLANISIDYLRESHWPGTVKVGSRITQLGRKSVTSGYGLFLNDTCRATAHCVNVYFDTDTRKSVEPPADIRAKILATLETQ